MVSGTFSCGVFLFFSLVIQISPNFYRTVAVYIVNWLIIVFSETNLPKAVHIGVGLISLLILLKMHMSRKNVKNDISVIVDKEVIPMNVLILSCGTGGGR